MSKVINVGIIGFGLAGRVFHGPIIDSIEGAKIKKIYTSSPENTKIAEDLHPEAKIVTDVNKIFSDKDIDLVVVLSPNTNHYELALAAIEAGKAVVVDKPFMVNAKDCDDIIAKAKAKGVMLSVYQNRRWDADYQTIKKLSKEGLLGEVFEIVSNYNRYAPNVKGAWRDQDIPGSGMLFDLGSHLIDQVVDFFGNPISIMADVRTQRPEAKVDDHFHLIMKFKNNAKATLKCGMLVRAELPRFVVYGQNGSYVKYGMDVQEDALKAGIRPKDMPEDWGKEPAENSGIIHTTINGINIQGEVESVVGDYRHYYRNIFAAMRGEEQLIVTPEQARNTIRIIEYAMESNKTGMQIDCSDLK